MKIFCPALLSGRFFPTKCANRGVRGGQNVSPALIWTEVPEGVKSFAVSVIDCHPIAKDWTHWFVVNIPPIVRGLEERASNQGTEMPDGCIELRNSFGQQGWGGPEPPRGSGIHPYECTVYALSVADVELGPYSSLQDTLKAITPRIITSASITGYFEQ
jgi:Raf kinase inhibitor-like YbhB/YbcL family protein